MPSEDDSRSTVDQLTEDNQHCQMDLIDEPQIRQTHAPTEVRILL